MDIQIIIFVYPLIFSVAYHTELFLRTDSLFRLLNLLVPCYFSNSVFGSMMSRAVALTASLNFSHRPTFYLKVDTHMRLMFGYQRTNMLLSRLITKLLECSNYTCLFWKMQHLLLLHSGMLLIPLFLYSRA